MTNYEKIKTIIEAGHIAVMVDDGGDFAVFRFVDDGRKRIWRSYYQASLEKALVADGTCEGMSWINTIDNEIYPLPQKPYPYKAGDKVKVLDIAREDTDFDPTAENLIEFDRSIVNKIHKIREVDDGRFFIEKGWSFPHWAICPAEVFEDEPQETINIGGTDYEVTDELKEALAKLKKVE